MGNERHSERIVAKKNLIGQMLIRRGLITEKQLEEALNIQKKNGGFLGDILTENKFVSQEILSLVLASQTEVVYLPIEKYKISKEVLGLIPREIAYKYHCVPLEKMGDVLAIAMVNPLDKAATLEIEKVSHYKLVSMIGTKEQIEKALQDNYPVSGDVEDSSIVKSKENPDA